MAGVRGFRFSWGLVLLVSAHFFLSLSSMADSSGVFDEADYIGAGRYVYETGDWFFSSALFHPPLSYYLNSVPLFFTPLPKGIFSVPSGVRDERGWIWYDEFIGRPLLYGHGSQSDRVLFRARLPNLILSALLILLIGLWAKQRWGEPAGWISAAAAAFSPNLLAMARFALTDIPLTFFYTFHTWAAWSYLRTGRRRYFFVMTLSAAAAASSKLNGIFTLPVGLAVIFVSRRGSYRKAFRDGFSYLLGLAGVIWLLYSCAVGPAITARNSGKLFATLTASLPGAEVLKRILAMPVPAPQYLRLWGNTLAHARRGHPGFLLGEFRTHGWWYYFPIAWLVKSSLPTILAVFFGTVRSVRFPQFERGWWVPLLAGFFILGPALVGGINIGIRHILPIYPLLFVFPVGALLNQGPPIRRSCGLTSPTSRSASQHPGCSDDSARESMGKPAVRPGFYFVLGILLGLLQFPVALAAYPSYTSFFNRAVGGIERGEKILSDSNIDFGEDFIRLARYQKEKGISELALAKFVMYDPSHYGVRYRELTGPTAGWVAVEVMAQQWARREEPNPLAWLDEYTPVDRVGGSIKIYFIPEKQ